METQDISSSLFFWRKAVEMRATAMGRVEKPDTGPHPVLGATEFRTEADLEELVFDLPAMRLQALLVTERVLGSLHKDTIYRYMYAGAAHADTSEYRQCIKLWNYALGLKIQKVASKCSKTHFFVVILYHDIEIHIVGNSHKHPSCCIKGRQSAAFKQNRLHSDREVILLFPFIEKFQESLLGSDTSFTVRAVVQLYLNILLREQTRCKRTVRIYCLIPCREELAFCDVLDTATQITAGLAEVGIICVNLG